MKSLLSCKVTYLLVQKIRTPMSLGGSSCSQRPVVTSVDVVSILPLRQSESPRPSGHRDGNAGLGAGLSSESIATHPTHSPPFTPAWALGLVVRNLEEGKEVAAMGFHISLLTTVLAKNESVWTEALGDKPPRRFYFAVSDGLFQSGFQQTSSTCCAILAKRFSVSPVIQG